MTMKRLRIGILLVIGALLLAGGLGYAYLQFSPRETPPGQPRLITLDPGDLTPVESAFDAGNQGPRVLVMLSPT